MAMGRPPKDIKAQIFRGHYRIMYAEEGHWHMTPEVDREKALAWARRQKSKFLDAASSLELRSFMTGFFDLGGNWDRDMKEARHEVGEKTRAEYAAMVVNYLDPLFGAQDPRELTAKEIKAGIRDVQGKFGKALTTATKYKLIHVMSLVMQSLAEDKTIDSNPLLGVQPYSKAPEAPRGALPRSVLAKLFPEGHGPLMRVWGKTLWATLMCVMYDSGMRPVELRALRWRDIHPEERAAIVRRPKRGRRTKDGQAVGIVRAARLSERTVNELKIWKAETAYSAPGDLIFTLDGAAAVTDAAMGDALRRGLEAIKESRPEWTPYWLRHSFVTYAMADLTSQEVASLAGHSVAIAEGTYSHPDDEVILQRTKRARAKLDGAKKRQSAKKDKLQ